VVVVVVGLGRLEVGAGFAGSAIGRVKVTVGALVVLTTRTAPQAPKPAMATTTTTLAGVGRAHPRKRRRNPPAALCLAEREEPDPRRGGLAARVRWSGRMSDVPAIQPKR